MGWGREAGHGTFWFFECRHLTHSDWKGRRDKQEVNRSRATLAWLPRVLLHSCLEFFGCPPSCAVLDTHHFLRRLLSYRVIALGVRNQGRFINDALQRSGTGEMRMGEGASKSRVSSATGAFHHPPRAK